MFGLILGALLGLLFIGLYMICRTSSYIDLGWFDGIVCSLILASTMLAGVAVDKEENRMFIAQYEAAKYTIEANLENEDLSDLTRMELLKEATGHNVDLATKQYKAQQWYGFAIPDEVLDLEPINLS